MRAMDERLCDPVSTAELERRWAAARSYMHGAKIDALVVQGANGYAGTAGYYRWLTGMPSVNSYPHTAILPRDGLMTLMVVSQFRCNTQTSRVRAG